MSRYGNDYGARRGYRGGGYGGIGPWERETGGYWNGPRRDERGYDRGFRRGVPQHPGSEYGGYGADTGWSAWENQEHGMEVRPRERGGYDRGFGREGRGGRGRGGSHR